jgi:hypothetical protein
LVARTVKLYEPPSVGVPERRPVVAFRPSPGGKAPVATVNVGTGVPVAVKV